MAPHSSTLAWKIPRTEEPGRLQSMMALGVRHDWATSLSLFTFLFIYLFIFISWRLINLQYCSGFCHTLKWISHGFTCVPHPDPPSHLPLHTIPLGLPSAPGLSACLMHPTWAGDLFHPTCFDAVLLKHPTLAFSQSPKVCSIHLCLFFTFHFHALEKEMATHSSVLAWRIPGPGSLVGCCL